MGAACICVTQFLQTNRPVSMRKDVIQQRFRRKTVKDDLGLGSPGEGGAQSFVFPAEL